MQSHLDLEIINLLSEGVIFLDTKGEPIGANSAGRAALAQWGPADLQLLMAAVEEANQSSVHLPKKLHFAGSDMKAGSNSFFSTATLCENGAEQYALVTREASTATNNRRPDDVAEAMLIGGGMRRQLRELANMLKYFDPLGQDARQVMKSAAHIESMLRQVSDLAELKQTDETFCRERFTPGAVIRKLLPSLPTRDGEISCSINDANETSPIYGESAWFEQAMQTLLTRLCNGCPPKGRVKVDIHQTGDFVSIFGRVSTEPVRLSSIIGRKQRKNTTRYLGLQSEICRRIIELHGGLLKIQMIDSGLDSDGEAAIDAFSISLPTGIPVGDRSRVSCASCRITRQSEQYARDLAYLSDGVDLAAEN